jgi:Cys-rich protein (TIGR01571 family)
MTRLNINLDQFDENGGLSFTDHNGEQQHLTREQIQMAGVVAALTLVLAFIVPQIVFAFLYKANVHDKKKSVEESNPGPRTMDKGHFHHGFFKFHENINEALCAFLCPTVRYADAYGSVGGSYWGSLCTFFGATTVFQVACTALVYQFEQAPDCLSHPDPFAEHPHPCADPRSDHADLLTGILRGLFFGVFCRSSLRKKLGDPTFGSKAAVDFFSWFFCNGCCALTQDSVEMDIALDVNVGCPCAVTSPRTGVPAVQAREGSVAPYEKLLGDAVVLEEGR